MATFYAFYPPAGGASANASIGTNGTTAPTSSTEVGGVGPDGNLHPISTDNSGVQNVNVVSSVLPTGASTSAAQTTGNTSLSSIDTKTPALVSGRVPVDGSGVTQPISGTVTVTQATGTNLHAVVDSSALPTGASTSALQTTGNTSLSSIDTKTPALGQALSAASVPVVLPATQITALTPPTTVAVTQATGTNLHTVVDSGTVVVTQPTAANLNATVTGTVAVTQATGTNLHTVIDSSALPTGAATSANQTTELGYLSTIAGTVSGGSQLTKIAGSLRANAPVYNVYSTTNINTGAYVQLIASTTSTTNSVHIFDSSGQAMILAVGASGSEVVQYYVQPGGDTFNLTIPSGSRVAYQALTANATSGYLLVNLLA